MSDDEDFMIHTAPESEGDHLRTHDASKAPPKIPDFPAYFEGVLRQQEALDTWDDSKLHSSDLGSTLPGDGCMRQVWLRVHGRRGNPKEVGSLLMLHKSRMFHELLQAWLSEDVNIQGWKVVGIEESVSDESGDGRLDVILEHAESGELLVLDLKTMNGRGFGYLVRSNAAKAGHKLQVMDYMRKKGARYGAVLYVDREGRKWMWQSPVFELDEKALDAAWARLRTNAERPDCPDPVGPKVTKDGPDLPWMCSYSTQDGDTFNCPFLDTEHCGGALPPEKRPKRRLVAKMQWVGVAPAQDVTKALKDSLKERRPK